MHAAVVVPGIVGYVAAVLFVAVAPGFAERVAVVAPAAVVAVHAAVVIAPFAVAVHVVVSVPFAVVECVAAQHGYFGLHDFAACLPQHYLDDYLPCLWQ